MTIKQQSDRNIMYQNMEVTNMITNKFENEFDDDIQKICGMITILPFKYAYVLVLNAQEVQFNGVIAFCFDKGMKNKRIYK